MYENVFWLGTPVLLGVLLGLLLPAPESLPEPFNRISSVIGWVRGMLDHTFVVVRAMHCVPMVSCFQHRGRRPW